MASFLNKMKDSATQAASSAKAKVGEMTSAPTEVKCSNKDCKNPALIPVQPNAFDWPCEKCKQVNKADAKKCAVPSCLTDKPKDFEVRVECVVCKQTTVVQSSKAMHLIKEKTAK